MHKPVSDRYSAALEYLLSRIDYERAVNVPYHRREFHLERMYDLLARLGNPHQALEVVHIAGTKGKGSTAAMIASILSAAGYRTGLYTSPHLDRIEERLMIDGTACSADEFVALLENVRPIVEEMDCERRDEEPHSSPAGPTYFEITTAMAFLHFAQQTVDIAVIEVGLGGRLDSTNVVQPLISVITSISFDHMKQLGSTLEAIAGEKAGIIKPGVPVVSGATAAEARGVIEQVASQRGARLLQLGVDFEFNYRPPHALDNRATSGALDFLSRGTAAGQPYFEVQLSLHGRHQAANAAVALATIAELRRQSWNLPEAIVRAGLATTSCPARIEIVSRRPTIVIDTAHNLASVRSLIDTLDESFSSERRLLLFAATQEKQFREMLEILLPRFERVVLTRYWNNPRGLPLDQLAAVAAEVSTVPQEVFPTPSEAWRRIRQLTTPDHLVCVTGSFFLAAEIRGEISADRAGRRWEH